MSESTTSAWTVQRLLDELSGQERDQIVLVLAIDDEGEVADTIERFDLLIAGEVLRSGGGA